MKIINKNHEVYDKSIEALLKENLCAADFENSIDCIVSLAECDDLHKSYVNTLKCNFTARLAVLQDRRF